MKRRKLLALAGGAVSLALAGCAGDTDEANGDNQTSGTDDEGGAMDDNATGDDAAGGNGEDGTGNGEDGTGSGNETENGDAGGNGGAGNVPSEVDDYLSEASEYNGSLEDMTGEDEATVEVGAGSDGLAFSPAAIQVDSGTTVTWEWTGEGGAHNVVHEDGEFESDLQEEDGATFEHTFEEEGNFLYYCNPHRSQGMKGAVVVGSGGGGTGGNGGDNSTGRLS
ncbi:halocyanin domain-containing protein [Halobacteriales archaeon QS_4_66_20]|nr:MAG: halocyanin domain-containing protein [Halobacteriales archaeon QS_4_66_20]